MRVVRCYKYVVDFVDFRHKLLKRLEVREFYVVNRYTPESCIFVQQSATGFNEKLRYSITVVLLV